MKVQVKCDNCGKIIELHPYRLKTSQHHFCDRACKGEWSTKNNTGKNHPKWMGEATITCDQCGRTFRRANTNKLARNAHNFCSRACKGEWLKTAFAGENNPNWSEPVRKPCDYCGKPLARQHARVGTVDRRYHFCNMQCRADWQSENRSGENSPLWQGGVGKTYGPKWKAQAAKARKRDGHKCRNCGKTAEQNGRELDVHHIRPFRSFGYVRGQNENHKQANALSNLVTLCHSCHILADREEMSF